MQVDFYILQRSDKNSCFSTACRLVEKAYQNNHQVYVYFSDPKQAEEFDNLLWTFSDTSFIPHCLYQQRSESLPLIFIGASENVVECQDILINLGKNIPACHTQCKRIIEIVPNDTEWKSISREHYRFYREKNFVLNTHKI